VQIALLVLEMAYTATRPAALVYVRRNEKRVKGSCIGEDDSDEDEEDNKERDDGKGDEDGDWGGGTRQNTVLNNDLRIYDKSVAAYALTIGFEAFSAYLCIIIGHVGEVWHTCMTGGSPWELG
jgi:hypothetical protein